LPLSINFLSASLAVILMVNANLTTKEYRRLTTLWASTSCYRDSFTFYLTTWPTVILGDWTCRSDTKWTELWQTLYTNQLYLLFRHRPYTFHFPHIHFAVFPYIITYSQMWANFLENVETSTSHSPMDLYGLLEGYSFTFTYYSEWYQTKQMDGAFNMNNSHL
jgi:hypothetical protein